jgi:hypothetical protein
MSAEQSENLSTIDTRDYVQTLPRVVQLPPRVGPGGEIIQGRIIPAAWMEDVYSLKGVMQHEAALAEVRAAGGEAVWEFYRRTAKRFAPSITDEELDDLTIRQLPRLVTDLMEYEYEAAESNRPLVDAPNPSAPEVSSL